MRKYGNKWILVILALLILLTVAIPTKAELLDQSIYSTGLKSETSDEINVTDVSVFMKDGLLEDAVRVSKRKGKFDILSFRLDTDATQIPSLVLSVFVNNLYATGKIIDGWGTQTGRVYAYNEDGYSVRSTMALEFTLSYGWNDLDVTPLIHLMDGFGFVKFRIVAVRNWFDISEARFSVINNSPVAVSNGPYNGIANNPVTFRGDASYDPDGEAITYLWDFGDGYTSTEANPAHIYTSAGRYTVTLTVTDTAGNSDTDTAIAIIINETFETIRPSDAYNPGSWINPSNGYDGNPATYTYLKSSDGTPSISFGGYSSNESMNAWQSKSDYWYSAWLFITFEGQVSGRMDDLIEIVATDRNGNLKHTILPPTVGVTKKEFVQKLNMSDWGDGFSNIENLRVRVNGYKQKGADGAESRVYDIRIDGDSALPLKDYTRGVFSILPGNDDNLTIAYSPSEVMYVHTDDGDRVSQSGSANQYMMHQFKEKTPSHNITINWNGQINEAGVEAYAQSFIPNNSGLLTGVGIFFNKAGSPNGYLRVRIKSELGGKVLAESRTITEAFLDIGGIWKTFTFDNPVSVTAGNTYYIEIWRDISDGINYPEVTVRECSNFEGSTWWRSAGDWLAGGYRAILFEVYIDNILDVNSRSCSVPISGNRAIHGLDWKNIYLEAYNRVSSSWVHLDTGFYDGSTTDIDLSGAVSSDYFDENGWTAVRVYASGNDSVTSLATDLIDFISTPVPPLSISITSPQDGAVITSSPITVSGNVSNDANVTVNDVQASVSNNAFSASIPLNEGSNTVTATATDRNNQTASHSINVILTTKGSITGRVTDSSTGLSLQSASVSVTDSLNITQTALTGIDGIYTIDGIASGDFNGSATRDGYDTYNFSGTMSSGQAITINAALNPVLPVISNIAVSNITRDSAAITWTTDQPADSLVEYGTTTSYGSSVKDSALITSHSITLANLTPGTTYHFKVTSKNVYGFSSSSGDDTFTTRIFTATTIGDYGNVTVMEVEGNYNAKNPDGSFNVIPRQEIAKEFFKNHPDEYDFFIIFSNFDFSMPDADAKAFYLEVSNDTQGIGKPLFDNSALFGSNGKLQGIIDMGNISNLSVNITDPKFEETIHTLAHEQMHRWGANVKFRDISGIISTALLGKDATHWSFLLDSDASVLYGNDWHDNGDGTFTSISTNKYYSPLDLYLMGLYDKSLIAPMLLIENPAIDPAKLPELGTTISGTARYIIIEDIIAAEGGRIPGSSESQKSFKTAFILITLPDTFTGNELGGIENIRNAWAGRFSALTGGKGSIADVTPSITIAIATPQNNDTITGHDVIVTGAIINNTGKETGVTVNGILAAVYGNQFIANHVPLQEGSNTKTITAMDTAGNTSTTSMTVNAVTTGNYIQLTSNIVSGIAPLEVTLRIDGSFSIANSTLNITGPVQPEILESTVDEYRVRMIVEGIYYFTASVTGPHDIVYEDTIAIVVMNKTQMDNLLKGKWDWMRQKLAEGNIDAAVARFAANSQGIYKDQFTALHPVLQDIVNELNMARIDMVTVEDKTGEYEILVEREGTMFSLHLKFIKDSDGLWKIWSF
ncbi:MAG: PKD domain-containing protein [Nitrospirae bacterium]|nr:PKD domain-containing protein [Nitrospirota bacterium]